MNKLSLAKKGLKLSEADKKILQAYSNITTDTGSRPSTSTPMNKHMYRL